MAVKINGIHVVYLVYNYKECVAFCGANYECKSANVKNENYVFNGNGHCKEYPSKTLNRFTDKIYDFNSCSSRCNADPECEEISFSEKAKECNTYKGGCTYKGLTNFKSYKKRYECFLNNND